jgi:DMSO/TMAO reductase YedYZ heme-binding membrane subunit
MPNGLGGMAMSTKEKLLFLWILAVVAFVLVFHHFWVSTVYALGRAVALTFISLLGLVKIAAGMHGVHLLL